MPAPSSPRRFAPLGCGIGAAVALGAFVYLAVQGNQAGTAAAAATLCLALAVLGALDLESFEGLGIKAKLRSTLSDAEQRLQAIDKIVAVLARCSFTQAASGTVAIEDAQSMVASLSSSLQEIGLKKVDIDALKGSLYSGIDWYHWLTIANMYNSYMTAASQKQRALLNDVQQVKDLQGTQDRIALYRDTRWPTYDDKRSPDAFRAVALAVCDTTIVAHEHDRETLRAVSSIISKSLEDCLSIGNYTPEAVVMLKCTDPRQHHVLGDYARRLSP